MTPEADCTLKKNGGQQVAAEPSESPAGELRRLLPKLRQIVGEGRRGDGVL